MKILDGLKLLLRWIVLLHIDKPGLRCYMYIVRNRWDQNLSGKIYHSFQHHGLVSLHIVHFFAIPPAADIKVSLPFIVIIISCSFFRNLFTSIIRLSMAAWCGWSILFVNYITNQCCLMTVEYPTLEIDPLHGRYTVNIVVLLLSFSIIVMRVHRPIPDLSFPFCNTADDMLFNVNIIVPPG